MTTKLTWAQAVTHIGDEARLSQYLKGDSSGSHPNFDTALSIADGQMRSRITSRYTVASYDALDSTTIPSYVQFYLFCLTLGAATAHDDGRPDAINNYAGIAAGWLDDLTAGKPTARIPELTEIASTVPGGSGGSNIRISGPSTTRDTSNASGNVFDPDNESGLTFRDPSI
jgi:hypothetical protein